MKLFINDYDDDNNNDDNDNNNDHIIVIVIIIVIVFVIIIQPTDTVTCQLAHVCIQKESNVFLNINFPV